MINTVINGDCLEKLKEIESNYIDAIVTDPPYGLSFMGKKWDYDVPCVDIWKECLRVLKPGGYLLSFAGTRTQHRMAVNIEDAGFEIRDMIAWVYGSGFPKSLNIGKAVDKLQGNEREDLGLHPKPGKAGKTHTRDGGAFKDDIHITKGTSEWEGWGTALKPALEPITVARKPLSEKTVAENCLKWGVGGINIDECRVGETGARTNSNGKRSMYGGNSLIQSKTHNDSTTQHDYGRFPANLILDGSDEVVGLFPNSKSPATYTRGTDVLDSNINWNPKKSGTEQIGFNDFGSASRFFYCAKASRNERNRGCEDMPLKSSFDNPSGNMGGNMGSRSGLRQNNHPTVKPIALMEYLVKLVSKEGSTILDPFAGSGTTGVACKNLKRNYILIEKEQEYIDIINKRLNQ